MSIHPRLSLLALVLIISLMIAGDPAPVAGLNNRPVGPQPGPYPVPEKARIAAPEGTGVECTVRLPCSVEQALLFAAQGDVVAFRGGVYRLGEIRFNNDITMQPYEDEAVIFKGSQVVTDWAAEGDVWRTAWPYHFDPAEDDYDNLRRDDVDMVWIDEVMLTPVDSQAEVVAGTFFMDEANDLLYIGTEPAGKTVEVTRYAHSFERVWWTLGGGSGPAEETGLTVRGLTFSHYAVDGFWSRVDETVLEHNVFTNNSHRGLLTYGEDNIVRYNEISHNRLKGAHFSSAHRLLFENNVVRGNSFAALPPDSDNNIAVKFGGMDGGLIRYNLVEDNQGNGIWLDVGADNNVIVNNIVRNNKQPGDENKGEAGIHFEISRKALIAGNLIVGNGTGIQVTTSAGGRIYNNTLVGNEEAIHILEYYRDDQDAQQGPGNAADTQIINNLISEATLTEWPEAMLTVRTSLCGSHRLVTKFDHNGYYRSNPSQPRLVIRWDNEPTAGTQNAKCDGQSQSIYETLASFQAAEPGWEQNSLHLDGGTNPFFVDQTGGDYHLQEGSSAIGAGAQLPPDIANALGWPPSEPVDLGACQTRSPSGEPAPEPTSEPGLTGRPVYLPVIISGGRGSSGGGNPFDICGQF